MTKKDSDDSKKSRMERNRLRFVSAKQLQSWAKELRKAAQDLDDYADALKQAKLDGIKTIPTGLQSAITKLQELMISQVQRRVGTAIIKAGERDSSRDMDE